MKTVLITGANGFIGRKLCSYFLEKGIRIKGVVRNPSQIPKDIEPIIVNDLCQDQGWFPCLKGVDTVYHLAALSHGLKAGKLNHKAYTEKKLHAINVGATQSIARAATKVGVKRFVYLSSIKANGDATQDKPFSYEDPLRPEDTYGISKQHAEETLRELCKESALELVIVRPPLVYGPGVKGNFLSLLRLCDTGLPLPLASIQNQRSLIYVENLVSLLYMCGLHPQAAGHTFLVHDQADISTPGLIRLMRRSMGRPSRLVPCPLGFLKLIASLFGRQEAFNRIAGSLRVDDPSAHDILGWIPPFSLQEGIKETVLWFKNRQKD